MTFDTLLCDLNVERIDLLQIDAEGYDAEIVNTIDLERARPHIICYEHMHLSAEQQEGCIQRLVDHGYRIAIGFQNTIACLS
jgi:hypothetical protein